MTKLDSGLLADVVAYNRQKYIAYTNGISFTINKDFERVLNSRYQKVSRIKKRLLYLIIRHKYIWFVTFTLNNDYINKSERTIRDKLKSVLNTHDFKYILNTDYGQKGTHRKHYHCILATNIDMDVNQFFQYMLNDSFGFTLSLPCLKGSDDLSRLTKYIDKLANHCIKASTSNHRLLYNFKGYDAFCPTPHDSTLQYKQEYFYFQSVSLLDKADTTGNLQT